MKKNKFLEADSGRFSFMSLRFYHKLTIIIVLYQQNLISYEQMNYFSSDVCSMTLLRKKSKSNFVLSRKIFLTSYYGFLKYREESIYNVY